MNRSRVLLKFTAWSGALSPVPVPASSQRNRGHRKYLLMMLYRIEFVAGLGGHSRFGHKIANAPQIDDLYSGRPAAVETDAKYIKSTTWSRIQNWPRNQNHALMLRIFFAKKLLYTIAALLHSPSAKTRRKQNHDAKLLSTIAAIVIVGWRIANPPIDR